MHVLTVIGTRPEAIKLAPVILAIRENPGRIKLTICATAQHREMLDQALSMFGISPDIDLDIMRKNQDLTTTTVRVLSEMRLVLHQAQPDLVMIQGDTTTVMAAALAAHYAKIPVCHVEAGLRTDNRYSPFPEEMNRRLASVLAEWHFCPTASAQEALLREGVPPQRIFVTGNTVVDALLWILSRPIPEQASLLLSNAGIPGNGRKLVLVTAHRRENFGQPLQEICAAISELALKHPELAFIYPVHPNPAVKDTVCKLLGTVSRVYLTPPVEYDVMAHLMRSSHIIMTDSGGIQEEAPSLGVPVLVLREETERPEGVAAGAAFLVTPQRDSIVRHTENLLKALSTHQMNSVTANPYGDGCAAQRIVKTIMDVIAR